MTTLGLTNLQWMLFTALMTAVAASFWYVIGSQLWAFWTGFDVMSIFYWLKQWRHESECVGVEQ